MNNNSLLNNNQDIWFNKEYQECSKNWKISVDSYSNRNLSRNEQRTQSKYDKNKNIVKKFY